MRVCVCCGFDVLIFFYYCSAANRASTLLWVPCVLRFDTYLLCLRFCDTLFLGLDFGRFGYTIGTTLFSDKSQYETIKREYRLNGNCRSTGTTIKCQDTHTHTVAQVNSLIFHELDG